MRFKKVETQPDILQIKRAQLNNYISQFNIAVDVVTSTIDDLGDINRGIEETINEIDAYQQELEATRIGLNNAKSKNDKVIANFRALLGEEA